MCVTPSGQELPASCLPRWGCFPAQVKLLVPAAAWCSVLGTGGFTQDSCSFSLPLPPRAASEQARQELTHSWGGGQGVPARPGGCSGHCTASPATKAAWPVKMQDTVVASAREGLKQGGSTQRGRSGTAALPSPWCSPAQGPGGSLGLAWSALPDGCRSGHPPPRTNPSRRLGQQSFSLAGGGGHFTEQISELGHKPAACKSLFCPSAGHRGQREHGRSRARCRPGG